MSTIMDGSTSPTYSPDETLAEISKLEDSLPRELMDEGGGGDAVAAASTAVIEPSQTVAENLKNATNVLVPPFAQRDAPMRPLSMLMNNIKSLNGTKRRKSSAIVVNLLKFVTVLDLVFKDSQVTSTKSNKPQIVIPDDYTKYYKQSGIIETDESEAAETKRSKRTEKTGTAAAANADGATAAADIIKKKFKESLHLELLMCLIQDLESRGATFQFSREALKYFLATRSRFVLRNNFFDTNHLSKSERIKNKTQQQLPSGAILVEYIKGTDSFSNALHRSCKDDVKALKNIIDYDISIPIHIYNTAKRAICNQLQYSEVLDENLVLSDFVKIPISGSAFKHAQIIVTRYLALIQDGNQFMINPVIEKDFTPMLFDSRKRLPENGFVIFEALIGVKSKIIDLVNISNSEHTLSDSYAERLAHIQSQYPGIKVLKPMSDTGNLNYLLKPARGFGTSYIKMKPLLTAAVIGISDRCACAALTTENSEKELVVITKFAVSGPAACMIATAPMQSTRDEPTVLIDKEKYSIVGDLESVSLFKEAILVEIKDVHKFGGLSDRPVSSREEYKQLFHATKDAKNNDAILEMANDPNRVNELIEILTQSACFERLRELIDCKLNFEPTY